MKSVYEKVLALDIGQSSVGLAFYDREIDFVITLEPFIKQNLDFICIELIRLVKEKGIQLVLFGLPEGIYANMSSENKIVKIAGKLKDKLLESGFVNLDFQFIDEGFTSFQAEQVIREKGLHLNQNKNLIHSISAKFILERYLSTR